MKFGVNYTPATNWFHSWHDLQRSDVQRDMEQIASLGVDHVRIFPLWPVVQPNRGLIPEAALRDVMTVVDVAGENGLEVNLDVIQGHLSSYDFLPAWIGTWHKRNMFTDPDVVAAQAELAEAFSRELASRNNVFGITLGNEVNQFAPPIHPDMHPLTPEQASAWQNVLAAGARTHGDPFVTVAHYDATWYDDRQPFEPRHAVEAGDATVVHSWVFNGAAQTYGALHPGSTRHAEYLLKLAAAWHREPGRPVWLQEVGAPTTVVPRADAPQFLEETIRHAFTTPDLLGITWWCSHDVSRDLLDFPEVEYDLGLFTNDGQLKPTGERFKALVAELKDAEQPAPSGSTITLDDTTPDYRSTCAPGGAFHRAWLEVAERDGVGPQVILSSRNVSVA